MADERDKVLKQAEEEADETEVEAHKLVTVQDEGKSDDESDEPDVEAHKLLK